MLFRIRASLFAPMCLLLLSGCGSTDAEIDASLCDVPAAGTQVSSSLVDSNDPGQIGSGSGMHDLDDPEILWEFPTGDYFGGVHIVNGLVYVTAGTNYDDRSFFGLDPVDGSVIQEFELDSGGVAPLHAGTAMFFANSDGRLVRYPDGGGKPVWTAQVGRFLWNLSPPLILNSVVVVPAGFSFESNARIDAVQADTGETLWTFEAKADPELGPSNLVNDGFAVGYGGVYIGTGNGDVFALDLETGEQCWEWSEFGFRNRPSVAEEGTFISTAKTLYALDSHTGKQLWQFDGISGLSRVAVSEGVAIIGSDDGSLLAIGARSGNEKWAFEGGNFENAEPAVVRGTVFAVAENGDLYAINAIDGSQLWRIHVGKIYGRPLVEEGLILMTTDHGLVALSV